MGANRLPQVPLLHAVPRRSQSSIIPAPGSSSAGPCSDRREGELQRCTGAVPHRG